MGNITTKNMIGAITAASTRTIPRSNRALMRNNNQQRRTFFIDWLMNRPDTVMEKKAIQMKCRICQGADNPTWLKQKGDAFSSGLGIAFTGVTMIGVGITFMNLANGTGKYE